MNEDEHEEDYLEEFPLNEDKVRGIDQLIFGTLWVLYQRDLNIQNLDVTQDYVIPIDTWAGEVPEILHERRTDLPKETIEGVRGDCAGLLRARNKELEVCLRIENGCLVMTPHGKIVGYLSALMLGLEPIP